MPVYVYREILPDGSDGELFEIQQAMSDAPLELHPVSGQPVKRVYLPPNLTTRYSDASQARRLDNKRVEAAGFTKYERDKLTGKYHKVAGKDKSAPSEFSKPKDL